MIIKEATFLTSAADQKGFLRTEKPVIAVCGKSNVGKSTFINMLANRNKLARTSAEPGRTRLVNYFDFGEFVLADLPGYGYARVSHAEKLKWARLLDDFFAEGGIAHVFALADIRHDPTADDLTMINFLYATQTPFTVIATKADKLAKTRVKEAVRRVAAAFKTGEGNVIAVSGQTRRGREEVLSALDKIVSVAAMPQAEEEDPAAGQEN
ncbi:MAG TPA: ribosome biogenesis GTP-binding protein YihA/YsxC [Candidatus Borkfalkia faecipullorum]|uniref:Probable GTP-binding protein EngB n=1 Tax=Candidatus Borkfalkia faecipullorum TaxID=2838510 RepID=A0A9D1V8V4_9FIRM|nr:ribosome biogenesis GTP-binding protein YihA/YsxC [Candidatus Borkfalkia faecipullorum]